MTKKRGAISLENAVSGLRADGHTVKHIASLVGLTTQKLNHLVAGRRLPTLGQALAIQDEFGIDIREWL